MKANEIAEVIAAMGAPDCGKTTRVLFPLSQVSYARIVEECKCS
jgi:hypothetical protein